MDDAWLLPRESSAAPAVAPAPAGDVPVEIPLEFRDQRARHEQYKRRGPPTGRRYREADIGETRTTLSSRFFDITEQQQSLQSSLSPPPPPPPPPPAAPVRGSFAEWRKTEEGGLGTAAVETTASISAAGITAVPAFCFPLTRSIAAKEGTKFVGGALTASTAVVGPTSIDPDVDVGSDACAERVSFCAGRAKRKAGPSRAQERKSESPRKAAFRGGGSAAAHQRPRGLSCSGLEGGKGVAALRPRLLGKESQGSEAGLAETDAEANAHGRSNKSYGGGWSNVPQLH